MPRSSSRILQRTASNLVLITGGGGYVGSALSQHLLENGWNVRILETSSRAASLRRRLLKGKKGTLQIQAGSVLNPKDVARACRGVTHAVHLAGIANVNDCQARPHEAVAINGMSTRNLLEQFRIQGGLLRFVYPSSVAGMYTLPSRGKVVETTPVFPVNDYGISKYLGEQFCRAYARLFGMPTVIFRQSNVYGPSPVMKYDNVVHAFLKRALSGEPMVIHGTGAQERDFIFMDDLTKAYEIALVRDIAPSREYNICSGRMVSIVQVAKMIQCAVQKETAREVQVNTIGRDEREIEIRRFAIAGLRAMKELDFAAKTSLQEGIKHLMQALIRTGSGRGNPIVPMR